MIGPQAVIADVRNVQQMLISALNVLTKATGLKGQFANVSIFQLDVIFSYRHGE